MGEKVIYTGVATRCLRATMMVGVVMFSLGLLWPTQVHAAGTIVVNNNGDIQANDGACTLREAIIAANTDTASGAAVGECAAGSGTDTINFAIAGPADFTNGGQNGHTIAPTSALPDITSQVVINGYSQTGAAPNTAVSPAPLNGILLIEIDGTNMGASQTNLHFLPGSANSVVRGLVINRATGNGIVLETNNITIAGNYIGTNPAGDTARANAVAGVTWGGSDNSLVNNIQLGGVNAADRNLISGNGSAGAFPVHSWVVQGNYLGLKANGTQALPNATSNSSGSLSIDNCSNVLVGGTVTGAANVISGNNSHGIAPSASPGLRIEGNLIGTDYTGTVAVPNTTGVTIDSDQTGTVIGGTSASARNIISGNTLAGVISATTGGLKIEGNYIGLNKAGTAPIANGTGIISADTNSTIGGDASARNVVSGNTSFNVSVQGIFSTATGITVSGNYIGTNAAGDIDGAITAAQGEGVRVSANASGNLIGKSDAITGSIGNLIAGNRGSGVAIRKLTITGLGTIEPTLNAVLGNQIYGNTTGGPIATAAGLGIDLYEATIATPPSFPADVQADTYVNEGPTLNDATDADTGPNNYMNFPVINSASQNDTALTVNFDLDAADSTNSNYRVEFFANDATDASGYGEGQTYLGSTTVSNGAGQVANLSLANGTNLTGKVITATTTAVNNTTVSGFGASSEFSQAKSISVTLTAATPALASTGQNIWLYALGALSLLATGAYLGFRRPRLASIRVQSRHR